MSQHTAHLCRERFPYRCWYSGNLENAVKALRTLKAYEKHQYFSSAFAYIVHGVIDPELEDVPITWMDLSFQRVTGEFDAMSKQTRRRLIEVFYSVDDEFGYYWLSADHADWSSACGVCQVMLSKSAGERESPRRAAWLRPWVAGQFVHGEKERQYVSLLTHYTADDQESRTLAVQKIERAWKSYVWRRDVLMNPHTRVGNWFLRMRVAVQLA